MPDELGGSPLPSKRLVQNEREANAGLAKLLGNVVRGGRDVFVGQAVAATRGWLGKQAVGICLGDLELFLGPIGGRADLPRLFLIPGDMSDQVGSDALRVCLKLVDELRIPEMVKVSGSEAGGRNFLVVAAAVVVVR